MEETAQSKEMTATFVNALNCSLGTLAKKVQQLFFLRSFIK